MSAVFLNLENPQTKRQSKVIKHRLPCPKCPSSDAYHIYDDGHGYCFSCTYTYIPRDSSNNSLTEFLDSSSFTWQIVPFRGLAKSTLEFFGIKTRVATESGEPLSVTFPYPNGASKNRVLSEKKFWTEGDAGKPQLFSMNKWVGGSAKAVTIYEGELDAASGFQMLGSKYPSVSVRSAASAKADCSFPENYKWLDSFERIYLCFDSDEPGQRAKRAVASLFDFNKVYDVALPRTGDKLDANKFLVDGREKEFYALWWNAKRFLPEGIISSFSQFKEILANSNSKPSVPYPFQSLTDMTHGIRTGEVVLVTALEGVGKTEIVRAVEHNLLATTDSNLAIIHLEESKQRTLAGLAGYQLGKPCHIPSFGVTPDETSQALELLVQRDDRLHLYSHFGSSDPDIILGNIRFLASACDCRYVFLDHISMVVSGLNDERERQSLDYISTRLAMMVEELDFSLFLVSHVNDAGQTRGSRNISKIADIWIHADRDLTAANLSTRNTTKITVKKNRFAGNTGPAEDLIFDPETYKLVDYNNFFGALQAPTDLFDGRSN